MAAEARLCCHFWVIHRCPPAAVLSCDDVLTRPCPVPAISGVYAWYFDQPPPHVPTQGCHITAAGALLYVGISPKAPPKDGRAGSRPLRSRIRYHFRGNAYGSTLRLTLGSLLSEELGIQLRRVGSGQRMAFGHDEAVVSDWMAHHAHECRAATATPWLLESRLIHNLVLPLNLDQNKHSGAELTAARANQRARARELPIS
ncbi:GIY-YIG nuclease family protein [Kribbella sp. VKM Ac-2568]|uniref:GIY-YIG nuclease family protein n=1 Tax=Kribbella sp. VKM Ac-2568 TaxID=2512219 RepID=UPI0010EFE2A1|nr:hypothetical protein [Kribbella sp. VKM Ac-2568]TCM41762.1 hypothetical protein EV648_111136 [Kribbella sp. VKM Ac-2568]